MPPSMPQSATAASAVKRSPQDSQANKKKARSSSCKSTAPSTTTAANVATASTMAPLPMMPMYGGGMSMYGGGGMYGGGLMGGMYGGAGGPLSGLNQALYGFQSLILSLGQAVQIVGMNTAALQQLLESTSKMVDHAIHVYKEMRAVEMASQHSELPEDKKRRRRLRALRWCIMLGVSYAGYKIIRMAFRKRTMRIEYGGAQTQYPQRSSAMVPYSQGYSSNYNSSPYGGYGQSYSPYNTYGGEQSFFR